MAAHPFVYVGAIVALALLVTVPTEIRVGRVGAPVALAVAVAAALCAWVGAVLAKRRVQNYDSRGRQ